MDKKTKIIQIIYVQKSKDANKNQRDQIINEINLACDGLNASGNDNVFNFNTIESEDVIHRKTETLDSLYNSDILIVDISHEPARNQLLYYITERENGNIVLFCAEKYKSILDLRKSLNCKSKVFPYLINDNGRAVFVLDSCFVNIYITDAELQREICNTVNYLSKVISQSIMEMIVQYREPHCEDLIVKIREERTKLSEQELRQSLYSMFTKLNQHELLSKNVVLNLLLSLQRCQDFDGMVMLIERISELDSGSTITSMSVIQYFYAFALNRRNLVGDRDKALKVTKQLLQTCGTIWPDVYGLLGRIYKDKFDSNPTDRHALRMALESYEEGYRHHPSEYSLINIATLLVVSGKTQETCLELRRIIDELNFRIHRKKDILQLRDYWDVATIFEVCVLNEEYAVAVQAAESMYRLQPPDWKMVSTLNNIRMIYRFRNRTDDSDDTVVKQLYNFWMEFLITIFDSVNELGRDSGLLHKSSNTIDETYLCERIIYPVLVSELDSQDHIPANLHVNIDAKPKNICLGAYIDYNNSLSKDNPNSQICKTNNKLTTLSNGDIILLVDDIKGINSVENDCRSVYLYLYSSCTSSNYRLSFSCETMKNNFLAIIHKYGYRTDDDDNDDDDDDEAIKNTVPKLRYEYICGENNRKVILGSGSFGTVYAGRFLSNNKPIAIKQINIGSTKDIQPIKDEVRLHSRLHHKNIVQYYGSVVEAGKLLIFMQLIPGESLSALLDIMKSFDEETVALYSREMLEGIKYLHDNRIIHRDIKADNVLINRYTGELKIADFGTSKRLNGLLQKTRTFKGTLFYMAPELIRASRETSYSYPADIWSFGCTVVQMLTGLIPFSDLPPNAAMYKIGCDSEPPAIPNVSDLCKNFVLLTFNKDPEKRATARELLCDPFIKRLDADVSTRWEQQSTPYTPCKSLCDYENADIKPNSFKRSYFSMPTTNAIGEKYTTIRSIANTLDELRQSLTTSVFIGDEDSDLFLKQEVELKQKLAITLAKEKQVILSNWIDILLEYNAIYANQELGDFKCFSDSFRDKLLSLLLDMLRDHLNGEKCWYHMTIYLKSLELAENIHPTNNSAQLKSTMNNTSILCEIGQCRQFVTLIQKVQTKISTTYSPVQLIFSYLRLVLISLPKGIYSSLKRQVRQVHEYLAWDKFIKDALKVVICQILTDNTNHLGISLLNYKAVTLDQMKSDWKITNPKSDIRSIQDDNDPEYQTKHKHGSNEDCNPIRKWLEDLNLPKNDLKKLEEHGVQDSDDFFEMVDKTDLWNMGLSGGTVFRIWRNIQKLRAREIECIPLHDWFINIGVSIPDLKKLEEHGVQDRDDFFETVDKTDLWNMGLSGGTVFRIWRNIRKLRGT